MQKKSTLLYLVDDFEKVAGGIDEWNLIMEENDHTYKSDQTELKSPSEHSVQVILDFAQSYSFIKSKTIDVIDMYLN
ncbi:MAG: hypothetical protein J7L96_06685 [Bacteroidales bacterium]|nr:hypothetical protein [Bacteroidales bacterium]